MLNVEPTNGIVLRLTLLDMTGTWGDQQTIANCTQFLPADARSFNATGPYIDYSSSLGEVVMQHAAGSCLLFVANS
jgi:hypothetical protein